MSPWRWRVQEKLVSMSRKSQAREAPRQRNLPPFIETLARGGWPKNGGQTCRLIDDRHLVLLSHEIFVDSLCGGI